MEEIKLVQVPVIQHELQRIGSEVTKRIQDLNIEKQVATEETIKALKNMRADLRKEALSFEEQRKQLKTALMNPYNDFEAVYKEEIIDKYHSADETLKSKINDFELNLKTKKRSALIEYFKEVCGFHNIDFLVFENVIPEITLSISEKKYKEQILEFVTGIGEDLELIKLEPYAPEIMIEFKKTLKASSSIATVRQRKEQELLEQERILRGRTNRRISQLQSLKFISNDMTKTYRSAMDEDIYVKLSEIETLPDEAWNRRLVQIEEAVKEIQKKSIPAPKVEEKKVSQTQPTNTDKPEQEIYKSVFEVTGTYEELMRLKDFMVANKINYKNI